MNTGDLRTNFPALICPACRKAQLEVRGDGIRCTSCNEQYTILDGRFPRLIPPDAEISQEEVAVQDSVAANYERIRYSNPWSAKYHQWWTDLMISEVDVSGRILDNGCGIGLFCERLPAADIIGLDISAEMLRVAGTKSDRALLADSQNIPFADATFDTIFARSLIHHLPDPERGISEMARVLTPGGEVVSIDTNRSLLSRLPRAVANRGEQFSEEHKNLHRKKLIEAFKKHFVVERVRFFGYVAYPLLGFPDLMNLFRFMPARRLAYDCLMAIDAGLALIPLVRTQSWGLLLKCRKVR